MTELYREVDQEDHIRGAEDAQVTLLEYGDYECVHCGRAYPIVEQLREHFGEQMRFVFRNYPNTDLHPHAKSAAEAAEAADTQGKFWEMHDVLFEKQDELEDEDLVRHATELGLDQKSFEQDLLEHRHASRVEQDLQGGQNSGVPGTPTFFINGVMHQDSFDFDTLREAIEAKT